MITFYTDRISRNPSIKVDSNILYPLIPKSTCFGSDIHYNDTIHILFPSMRNKSISIVYTNIKGLVFPIYPIGIDTTLIKTNKSFIIPFIVENIPEIRDLSKGKSTTIVVHITIKTSSITNIVSNVIHIHKE